MKSKQAESSDLNKIRLKAKDKLLAYTMLSFPNYDANWHHKLICDKLEKIESGEIKRLMIFMPPRHGKSMLASEHFPAWYLGKNPEKQVMSCSYNDGLAEEFSRKVRDLIKRNEFKWLFNTGLHKESKKIGRWNLEQGGGYLASGVGGGMTGYGADLLIIDDPVKNQDEANSPTYRNRAWDWFTTSAYSRLHTDAAVILIMTRWHDDDLAGRLLQLEPEKWEILNFPAIATEKEKFRKKGEPLWKNKYNLKTLSDIKSKSIDTWASLYQQNPIISETQDFKRNWFRKWVKMPAGLRRFTTVDPAIAKGARSDDSVVLTAGIDKDNNIYILDYTAAKMDPGELIDEIFKHTDTWNSEKVGIEAVQYQRSLEYFMTMEMRRRKKPINIECIDNKRNKESNILALVPYYKQGMIFHPFDSEKLDDQLARFPSGKHDDVIDALAMVLRVMKRPSSVNMTMPVMRYNKKTGDLIGVVERKFRRDG